MPSYKQWMNTSFGRHTPWGDEDSPTLVTEVETELEKQLNSSRVRDDEFGGDSDMTGRCLRTLSRRSETDLASKEVRQGGRPWATRRCKERRRR